MKKHLKPRFAYHLLRDQRGAAMLMVIVILMALVFLVVSRTAFRGIDDLDISQSTTQSSHTVLFAESCVEEALLRLSRDANYAGGIITFEQTDCTITISGTPCGTCLINVVANENDFVRNMDVGVVVTGTEIDITSWNETE